MLSKMNGFEVIYLYADKSDLRKGIDGPAVLVKEQFNPNPFQKDVLFLSCGARSGRFKRLVWEGDGFCPVYKRTEAGRLRWLHSQQEAVQLSQAEPQRLLDGMTILERPTIKKVSCAQVFQIGNVSKSISGFSRAFLVYFPE